jgi:trehalose-6-phosphate hydrolase
VADYCGIDPLFGTMADFEELVRSAKAANIGVILDMVFNHTSTEHDWFQKALAGDPYYRDFYFFRAAKPDGTAPTNWTSKFGGSAWEKAGDSYYLHLFDKTQADLNWANKNVRDALYAVLRFWDAKGVSGFRFDVINLISKPPESGFIDDAEGDGRRFYTDGAMVHAYLKEMNAASLKDKITVGEMSSTSIGECVQYSGENSGELTMAFHFHHLKTDYPDGEKWKKGAVDFASLKNIFHTWQCAMQEHNAVDALFWNNHDQPRAITRFASKKSEYHYKSATMLAAAIHFMRVIPYIYMGEQIGMTNPDFNDINEYRDVETHNYFKILRAGGLSEDAAMAVIKERSRDNSRTPMQWTAGAHAGFTDAVPWIKTPENKAFINVDRASKDDDSVLAFYKKLCALRKKYKVIQSGNYTPLCTACKGTGENEVFEVLAYKRETETETLISVHNFFEKDVPLPQDIFGPRPRAKDKRRVLLSNCGRTAIDGAIVLEPYETLTVYIRG